MKAYLISIGWEGSSPPVALEETFSASLIESTDIFSQRRQFWSGVLFNPSKMIPLIWFSYNEFYLLHSRCSLFTREDTFLFPSKIQSESKLQFQLSLKMGLLSKFYVPDRTSVLIPSLTPVEELIYLPTSSLPRWPPSWPLRGRSQELRVLRPRSPSLRGSCLGG